MRFGAPAIWARWSVSTLCWMGPIRYRWCWGRTSFMRWRHWLSGSKIQPKWVYLVYHGIWQDLTSFKASQILMELPQVHKVVFVVDRKDLDYQTTKEFNSFLEGCVDGTDNTQNLVKQFRYLYWQKGQAKATRLIVTTIQKLNTAISKLKYEKDGPTSKTKRIIFIFDECHRSQFGIPTNASKNSLPRPDV